MSALGWWLLLGCTTPPPADPGVLLVVTDGVRGDRVGRAAAVGEMPTLDALAAAGTRFDRAYTVSTSAPAALGSLISGVPPVVHGMRGSKPLERLPESGWLNGNAASIQTHPPDAWGTVASVLPAVDPTSSVDVRLVAVGRTERSQSTVAYDADLRDADDAIRRFIDDWRVGHPQGTVVVVGLRGALAGARVDAELNLTDDWLHVPMLAQGPSIEVGWAVTEPVSTLDLAAWLFERTGEAAAIEGRDPFLGGSPLPYSESVLGQERFGASILQGFTSLEGRYVSGTYGEWYAAAAGDAGVRPFPNPRSEYPHHHETLTALAAEWGDAIPPSGRQQAIDPRSLAGANALLHKARRAIDAGRIDAAQRIAARLQAEHPSAPAVVRLLARIGERPDGPPQP
ncbi:MAG: hypothetical protein VX127_01250 [Myxococcota bacterium]|nr:hypothetical protein [Myxococcota bacterium]